MSRAFKYYNLDKITIHYSLHHTSKNNFKILKNKTQLNMAHL